MKISEWMNGCKIHSSFADRTAIIKQKGWFHTNIEHLCSVPEESVLSQPTVLADVHIIHKRYLSGCVWMGVYVGGNLTICVLIWVRERWVKMRKNNLHPNTIFEGCAIRKLNMTQESIKWNSIYTDFIPKVCFHLYLDWGTSETQTTHAESKSFPAVVKRPWVDTSNTFECFSAQETANVAFKILWPMRSCAHKTKKKPSLLSVNCLENWVQFLWTHPDLYRSPLTILYCV